MNYRQFTNPQSIEDLTQHELKLIMLLRAGAVRHWYDAVERALPVLWLHAQPPCPPEWQKDYHEAAKLLAMLDEVGSWYAEDSDLKILETQKDIWDEANTRPTEMPEWARTQWGRAIIGRSGVYPAQALDVG
jgi:hypothetical protein